MNIVLFGFKGSGKTYWGRLLAEHLDRPFIDTDDLILARFSGSAIRSVYETLGEAAFRALETEVISTLSSIKKSVISVGGGAVLAPENVERLQRLGQMIYLEASLETLLQRGVSLAAGPIEPIYRARKPIYESIPALRIRVDGL